jgi:hypothetical protein
MRDQFVNTILLQSNLHLQVVVCRGGPNELPTARGFIPRVFDLEVIIPALDKRLRQTDVEKAEEETRREQADHIVV